MTSENAGERQRLENVSEHIEYEAGVNGRMISYSAEVFGRWFTGESVLELGPAQGGLTQYLVNAFRLVEVVEGSSRFAQSLSQRFGSISISNCLFEEYEPSRKFDTVVLGHVLEHVENPQTLLQSVRRWLAPAGRVLAATPNGDSLHRQIGVEMGLLNRRTDLNDSDRSIGHRRVFTPRSLKALFQSAGYTIEHSGGYFLKVLSNSQLERACDDGAVDAMMKLGESYPEVAAEIYVVAK